MAPESEVFAVVNRWRTSVKNKFRGIASFAERAELRFNAIKQHICKRRVQVNNWEIRQAHYLAWKKYKFVDRNWRPIRVGETWGGEDITAFFRQRIRVPRDFAGETVVLHVFFGGDSLVTLNGKPYHGLDIFRNELQLTPKARAGEVFDLQVESFMNFSGSSAKINDLVASDLVAIDREIRDAYWDLWCVAKVLQVAELDSRIRDFIETHLWEAMKLVPTQEPDPAEFKKCVLAAQRMVRDTIYSSRRFRGRGLMHLVGHSHLDVVFMWTYKEFIRKVGRTHATMLRLMEQYPDFKFAQSQAKIYADMKQYHPEIFRQVRRRVAQKRWELLGAFWVEPDCNTISGESFVRQILHGQKFFRENFGLESRSCWQPDVFGLSWTMPQILVRSGIKYFVTSKLVSWSDTNPWTMNTFWWEGFDGTRILSIVPPGHFIGTVDADVIDKQWRNFNDKETVGETLHVYGWGDGGGGVDPEMIESGRRYADMPGLVRMRFSSAEEAFDSIARKSESVRLPVLRDEIYLEAHRGTYTHKGRIKKLHRRAELLYREAELLAAFRWTDGAPYPAATLDAGWKDLLTSQFHDSLPGTHIPPVYTELQNDHARVAATGEKVRSDAVSAIAGRPSQHPDAVLLFNSMGFVRNDCASVPSATVRGKYLSGPDNKPLPQQDVVDLDGTRRRIFRAAEVPSVGFRVVGVRKGASRKQAATGLSVTPNSLENEYIRAKFNEHGELVSLINKDLNREMLARGERGNVFQMFEDTPGRYDAWDIVETYQDHPIDISGNARVSIDERGPVRVSLRLEKRIVSSKLVQRISLSAGDRQLRFETRIDWVERQRLLKVAFPVAVNSHFATYDIAYGNMQRANHRNTSRDRARFEVPAHQWMDLSQADYGVSILNDCKYGCDTLDKTMRLTLLKGSIYPDPKADMETHFFTYSVYPHAGSWRNGTIEEAACLNHPVLTQPVRRRALRVEDGASWFRCEAANLSLEAVKRSEDGKSLVVRLVDRHNVATRTSLMFAHPVKKAWSCDLMERREKPLKVNGRYVFVEAKPYEILTIRVAF